MKALRPIEILLQDPLREITRKERRSLLGVSIVSIAIVKTGLVPKEITALGIKFSETDKSGLLLILAAVVLYFFAAFVLYAVSDLLAWRWTYEFAKRDSLRVKREQLQTGNK